MRSFSWSRFVGAGALVVFAAGASASALAAKPAPGLPGRPRTINLFSSSGLLFQTNRLQCGVQNDGQTCVAFAGSPVGGGGFWPKGTPDQYIFNSGLQIGVVVDPNAGFEWAGDTTGAYFFDARGDQLSGEGLTGWYNALDPGDIAAWPPGAYVRDAIDSIYNPLLLGQKTISQGDAWVRYWEGNPNRGPRSGPGLHPAGILVDQRALAWNYPSGNEDIVYFVFTFYNVSARSSSGAYNNPTIPDQLQAEIAAVGDRFQDVNEQKFGINIPDGGYALTSIFADFAMDADVAVFSQNYGTAFLPFNIGSIYTGTFLPEVGWQFPPDIFGPPFAAAPGFIGVKYLKSPESSPGNQVGLTMFSMTTNGAPHRDPVGVGQLYRYMSGFLGPSDDACSPFTDPAVARARHLCYLATVQSDSRFFQASGPFDLAPGHATSIVVAYIQAAPVDVPGLVIGGDLVPGVPAGGDSIFADTNNLRVIDRIAGWVTQTDRNNDRIIQQDEVTTVPRSLLNKALVAQDVFDGGFLLPNAPTAPKFYLVPGDNQVTVVWEKSETETTGDPFFAAAQDATSALYDPNFRQYDVEGYRIYRGRTSSALTLISQVDYAGTSFVDYTGAISDYGDVDGDGLNTGCAPELAVTADCPSFPAETDLSGNVIQVPPGGRTLLASGGIIILNADTAVTGGGSGFPALSNTGVPFAYVDRGVRNAFTYFYAVTAFDVNSTKSGPTSLESPRVTKSVTPRRTSGQFSGAAISAPQLVGSAGQPLDPSAPLPTLDPNTGIFSGPMPPTDQFVASLAAFIPEVLVGGQVDVRIDSIVPGPSATPGVSGSKVAPALYYVTGAGPTGANQVVIPLQFDCCEKNAPFTTRYVPVVNSDAAKAGVYGGDGTFSLYSSLSIQTPGTWRLTSWGRGSINGLPATSDHNGPRWWTGAANENTDDPNGIVCSPAAGDCATATNPLTDLSRNAGGLPGVGIFHILSYLTTPNAPGRDLEGVTSSVTRAADFRVVWGANGAIDSVYDVTHQVPVSFSPSIRASWGILNDSSFVATTSADGNNNLLTWADPFCVDPMPTALPNRCAGGVATPAPLMDHARLSPIALQTSSFAGTAGLAATGNGFIFYLNGHFFLMQLAALPTAGTVWNARFYAGSIIGTPGSYEFRPSLRPPAVPGLRASFTFTGSTLNATVTNDSLLRLVHTVPDPYYVTNALEITTNSKILKFVNVPTRCLIRIYSLSGVLVQLLAVDDPGGSGEASWNLRNRNNQFVASGVYFYQLETPDGKTKVGRFTIVNFAP